MDYNNVQSSFAKNSSEVVHNVMAHLHKEVDEAEIKIQVGLSDIWKEVCTMLQHLSDVSKANLMTKEKELCALHVKISDLERTRSITDDEKFKLRSELEDALQKLDVVSEEHQQLKQKFEVSHDIYKTEKSRVDKDHALEISKYKDTIQEMSESLKAYQTKITRMTSKMNQLSEQIVLEKTSSEKAKKTFSSQLSNQTAEAKKSVVEMTKLKMDIANSNKALAMAKQNIKKLQIQLHETKRNSESIISELQKQHSVSIKSLNQEILSLQQQLEELKRLHQEEIDCLKEKRKDSDKVDFLEDRIRFLQHQNRREKVKIQEKVL